MAAHVNSLQAAVVKAQNYCFGSTTITINDTIVPVPSPVSVQQALDSLASTMKSAVGESNWYVAPSFTHKALYGGGLITGMNADMLDGMHLEDIPLGGGGGTGLPVGGLTGQVLAKASDANFDTEWIDIVTSLVAMITGAEEELILVLGQSTRYPLGLSRINV